MCPGLLSDELSGQQSQSGNDVEQHQHPVSSSLQPSATDSHSDPAPTTAATAATATGPHQERPVADHHQLGGQPATQYQQQGTEHHVWREDHHLFSFQDNFNYINNQPSSGSRGLISTASSGPVQGKMPPAIR